MRIGCSKETIIQVTSIELQMEGEGKILSFPLKTMEKPLKGMKIY
jgi:hypothetical protein